MNKKIIIIFFLIITAWQLKSENLELSNEEKKIFNSFFENENEYITIVSKTENLLNCQTGYLKQIALKFDKNKIKFAYTCVVNSKNESYLIKKYSSNTQFNEVLNKNINILTNLKSDYLLIYQRYNNFTCFEIKDLKNFFENDLKYYTDEFIELKFIKNILDYNKSNPIISLNNLDDKYFFEFYNNDLLVLDSNFNLQVVNNYTNKLYKEDYNNDGINDINIPPILSTVTSTSKELILYYSQFAINVNQNYYTYPSIFVYNIDNFSYNFYNIKNDKTFIQCQPFNNDLFLLNDINNQYHKDKNNLLFKFDPTTSILDTFLEKSKLKEEKYFKSYININEFAFNMENLLLFDYSNQVIFKFDVNDINKEYKLIDYSKFIKSFNTNLQLSFYPNKLNYYIYNFNHSLIIKEEYLNKTDSLISRSVYKLPTNLIESDIIYFLEFKRNDKTYYMLKTNDIGFVLLEQP